MTLIERTTYACLRVIANASDNIRGLRGLIRRSLPLTVASIRGRRFKLHPTGNLTEWIMFKTAEVAEPLSIDAILQNVSSQRCFFIDIGANCGSYSIVVGAEMAYGSQIIAVEPNPNMALRLQTNINLNGMENLIRVEQAALGGKLGEATLHLDPKNLGQSSLLQNSPRETQGIIVPVKPLADLLVGMHPKDLFVIKVDVEGFEDHVLLPYFENPQRMPDFLLMETDHAKDWGSDILGKLAKLGYQAVFQGEGNTLFKAGRQS